MEGGMGVWRELTAWKGCDKAWKRWAAETLAHWDAREKEVLAREEVWKAEEREWREESSALIHAGVYIGWLLGYAQGILDMVHALARNRNSA